MPKPASNSIDWPQVLESHKPWLAKVLRCRIGDFHAVDDLLQEIALAVIRQSSQNSANGKATTIRQIASVPSDPDKVAPWLYRLAVRQAVNFHRHINRKSHAVPTAELESVCQTPSALDGMLASEQQQQFRSALQRLTPSQREILALKFTENWSYQRLADHLGIPVRSVEYRLLVARNELRSLVSSPDGCKSP